MQYDIGIVLGGGRDSNDSLNLRTVARLRKAVELFQTNRFKRMILSGGISFSASPDITRSEAALMREYLLVEGIPDDCMLLEETSTDTLGNAYFSKEQFLILNPWRSIVVVTTTFHANRCQYLFQKVLGPDYIVKFETCSDNVSQKEIERLVKLESHIREVYAHWLDPVSDGDSDAINKILFERHPGHALNPDFTKEQFVRLLYDDFH